MKVTFLICGILLFTISAANGREPALSSGDPMFVGTWDGAPGRGADVLFLFLAFDNMNPDTVYACGDLYWNPKSEFGGFAWDMETIHTPGCIPSGNPYHWSGGLGLAMDVLGYTWEWYAGFTNRCGQVIPEMDVLDDYSVLIVMTFDAYRGGPVLTSGTRSILESYIIAGGHVILISQDAKYSGIPNIWLDDWFDCGIVTNDVTSGTNPFKVNGLSGSFMSGWSGTAQIRRFSSGAGGHGEGNWWADDLQTGLIFGDASWEYASASEEYRNIFSTFEYEACDPDQVQSATETMMNWIFTTSLQHSTWAGLKRSF